MISNVIVQKARGALCLSLFLFITLALVGCNTNKLSEVVVQGKTMGTYYNVKVVASEKSLPSAHQLSSWADAQLESINQSMSTYIDSSELSLLNRQEGEQWHAVSDQLFDVLAVSENVSLLSGGAFDITVMPLVNLWGFGPHKTDYTIPANDEISNAKSRVGFKNITLDDKGKRVKLSAGVTMDLSAVAKGYAADVLANYLAGKGFANVLVEVGGELTLRGKSVRGDAWRIGVETPSYAVFGAGQSSSQTVSLSDRAMATSGDYRNYYEIKGKRYSHTINPVTGVPITHNTASVTVIANTCAEADALATAFNVLGAEKAMPIAQAHNIAVYFIVKDDDGFKASHSEAFKAYINNL